MYDSGRVSVADTLGFIVVAVILLVAALLVGSAAATASSPSAVQLGGIIAAALAALTGWFLFDMISDASYNPPRSTGKIIFSVLMFGAAMIMPIDRLLHGAEQAAAMRRLAPQLHEFALVRFEQLDSNHDNVLDDQELKPRPELRLSERESYLLNFMSGNLSEIGHVTSSYEVPNVMVIPDGNGGSTIIPTTDTYNVYGISPEDLRSYPERVNELYKEW